jgi:hypothetical protein
MRAEVALQLPPTRALLAVVHGTLRDHNAELQLRSAPDQGTCFSIWLAGAGEA